MDRLQTQMPFGLFPECPKGGPATLKDSSLWSRFRGPTFFDYFSIFEQKISACSGGPQSSIEMQLFLAFLLASRLGSSLSGGDMPRGSNLVYTPHKISFGSMVVFHDFDEFSDFLSEFLFKHLDCKRRSH